MDGEVHSTRVPGRGPRDGGETSAPGRGPAPGTFWRYDGRDLAVISAGRSRGTVIARGLGVPVDLAAEISLP
jgi:hypothetical protein